MGTKSANINEIIFSIKFPCKSSIPLVISYLTFKRISVKIALCCSHIPLLHGDFAGVVGIFVLKCLQKVWELFRNNFHWNQTYIPFLVKYQYHSVHLLTYRHLFSNQRFRLCHLWHLCKYKFSLMMIYLAIMVFFHLKFCFEYSFWVNYFSLNN